MTCLHEWASPPWRKKICLKNPLQRGPISYRLLCNNGRPQLWLQQAGNGETQEDLYNGWMHDQCITSVFCICLDGTVRGSGQFIPSIFLFWRETFSVPDCLTASCVTKNQTDKQQTASIFLTPWKLPPHDCKIPFSFQQRWRINSLIGDCQCMNYLIICALTISNLGFSCSFGHSYKKHCFQRGHWQWQPRKHPPACFVHPSTTLWWYCVNAKMITTMLSSSLIPLCLHPMLLCLGGQGDDDDNNDNLRCNDNVHDVPPHPPGTQQPAIVGGGGDCNGDWDGDGNGDGDSNGNSNGNGEGNWQRQRQQQEQQQHKWWQK